jgi:hypothetical protein
MNALAPSARGLVRSLQSARMCEKTMCCDPTEFLIPVHVAMVSGRDVLGGYGRGFNGGLSTAPRAAPAMRSSEPCFGVEKKAVQLPFQAKQHMDNKR